MRVLQVTDLVWHLELPYARCLASKVGMENFRYVAVKPLTADRVKLGWNTNESDPWILRANENESDLAEFERWWDEADVVLCGERLITRFADRLRRGKLTFYTSERWWKPPLGIARLLHPRFAWMAYRFCRLAQSPCFHYLPVGGNAGNDIRRITSFRGRLWDWGYFTPPADSLSQSFDRNGALRILWAGRMLSWKRVDTLLRAFALLRQRTQNVHLTLIGDGPCRNMLQQLARKLGVSDYVDFHPCMPVAQVRKQMQDADIYVLPSNGYEGWGAVLNEAMSEGCAIVASDEAGAAKSMIRHGENGFLFTPGDCNRLGDLLFQLSADEPLRRRLAEASLKTITEIWSPATAAERFLAFSDAILAGKPLPTYTTGPMASV